MSRLLRFAKRLFYQQDGPTTTEYAILLALILLTMLASIEAVGNPVLGLWEMSGNDMNSAMNAQN